MQSARSDKHKSADEKTRYFLTMFYDDSSSIGEEDVLSLHRELGKVDSPRDKTEIIVTLHSTGGLASSAYKIANMMRSKCADLTIIVPQSAKSAATLMALAADKIVMGQESELGPLDLPIEHPLQEGIFLSALDGVNCLEYLPSVAANMAFKLGLRIRQKIGLSRRDSIQIAADFSRGFMEPIVAQLDPLVINMCYRSLHIAEQYGREILKDGMFKTVTDAGKKAEETIHTLVWEYPEHGFAISSQEAKRLGLNVEDAEQFGEWERIWGLHMQLLKQGKKVIQLVTADDASAEQKSEKA